MNQYHKDKRNHFPSMKVADTHGYLCPSTTFAAGEAASRFHGASECKHDGEPTQCLTLTSIGIKRSQGSEGRVPLPPGRVYNNKSAVYH